MNSNNIETIFSKLFTNKKLVNIFTPSSNIIHTKKEVTLESVTDKKGSNETNSDKYPEITLFIY